MAPERFFLHPSASLELREATRWYRERDATAGSLVFMGAAGQRAFVGAVAATSKPLSLVTGFDLFLPALRVDASELVKDLIELATDETKPPANRGIACTFLAEIGGQASPVVPTLRNLARDHAEDIARRCGAAGHVEDTPEMASVLGEGPAIEFDLTKAAPALDATAAAAWTDAVRKTLGGAYVVARVAPRSTRSIKVFVTRVSGLGVTPSGYLSLGPGLEWPEAGVAELRHLRASNAIRVPAMEVELYSARHTPGR